MAKKRRQAKLFVLSRMLTELYSDGILAEKLAFRGGTAIHKLYLSPQPRFSDDIDLVQIEPEPIGEILDRIRVVFSYLGKPGIKQADRNTTIIYRYISESLPQATLRIKIEINCREHFNAQGYKVLPFNMQNPWFTGSCGIVTYSLDELVGTKIRALYQRRKGRDLFDIITAAQSGNLDSEKSIFCYRKYMELSEGRVPSAELYYENLSLKIVDPVFRADIDSLLRPGIKYDSYKAYEMFKERFIIAM